MIKEGMGWQGTFEIYVNGNLINKLNNRVMDAALDKMIEILRGQAPNLEIKYLAVGTSSAAVANNQTQLGNEIFRTQPSTATTKTNTGEETTEFTILDTEAVATIEEIGIFGGSTATSTANSGTLISRILWHKVKSNSEEITFKRIDKVVRA